MCKEKGYWYCHNCKEELGANRVTFGEKCDTCGHPVIWIDDYLTVEEIEEAIHVASQLKEHVKTFPYLIKFFRNPTEEMMLEAVRDSWHNIQYIENPTDKVLQEVADISGMRKDFIKRNLTKRK